jgi:hypothetical protein
LDLTTPKRIISEERRKITERGYMLESKGRLHDECRFINPHPTLEIGVGQKEKEERRNV